jgi:hypothetical protein
MLGFFSLNLISKYKKEIAILLAISAIVGYIGYLHHTVTSLRKDYSDLEASIKKERMEATISANNTALQYKDLESKYEIEVLKKQAVAKETIKTEIQYIKGDDVNHTLIMDGNCTEFMKGRYNDKNAINRLI